MKTTKYLPALLKLKTVLLLCVLTALSACAEKEAACNRACVQEQVNSYVAALVTHDPARVTLADTARSTQNGEETAPGDGVWQTIAEPGGFQQTFIDDSLQSATHFGAFTENRNGNVDPLLLAIRFKFDNGLITEVEHLVSRPDQRNRLIRVHKLTGPNPVYDIVLPEAERSSRAQLIAAADAYFDGIAQSTDEGVPMHRECIRRENGVVLLKNDDPENQACPIGFHRFNYITDIRDRRVAVVDEARGLVLVWAFFDIPGNVEVAPGRLGPSDLPDVDGPRIDTRKIPRSLYIAELFRVVGGEIKDIDAIMYNLDFGAKAGW